MSQSLFLTSTTLLITSHSWWQWLLSEMQWQCHHILTFPWSLSTCSTVSPSWPIVSLETKIKSFLLRLLLNVDMFGLYSITCDGCPPGLSSWGPWRGYHYVWSPQCPAWVRCQDIRLWWSDVRSFKVTWRKGVSLTDPDTWIPTLSAISRGRTAWNREFRAVIWIMILTSHHYHLTRWSSQTPV